MKKLEDFDLTFVDGDVLIDDLFVQAIRTERGGFTDETLKALQVYPSPKAGWLKKLRGELLPVDVARRAVEGKYVLSRCTLKELKKNRNPRVPKVYLKEITVKVPYVYAADVKKEIDRIIETYMKKER